MCGMSVKELFDFVTDLSIANRHVDVYLEKAMAVSCQRSPDDLTEQDKVDEAVSPVQRGRY